MTSLNLLMSLSFEPNSNSGNEKKKKKKSFSFNLSSNTIVVLVVSLSFLPVGCLAAAEEQTHQQKKLRFGSNGEFKILQVADMHYADGKSTPCLNVLPSQVKGCSDLNTSVFIHRMILAEKPDLVVFTGKFCCRFTFLLL